MMRKILKFITILLLVGSASTAVFFVFRYKKTESKAVELEQRAETLLNEKEKILEQKAMEERQMRMLKKELAGLADVKNIKMQYEKNRKLLTELDKNYSMVSKEKDSLKQENLSLNSRIKSLTNEFTKTLETLKTVKEDLKAAKSDKTIKSYLAKIERTDKALKEKDQELKKMAKENAEADKYGRSLEKKINKLEKEKSVLERKLKRAQKAADKKPNKKLLSQIGQLRRELNEKEAQRRQLNSEVVRLSRERIRLDSKLNFQSEKIANLEEELRDIQRKARNIKRIEAERDQAEKDLGQAEKQLREQEKIIAVLKKDKPSEILAAVEEVPLSRGSADKDVEKAYALYDTAKAQVVKFSEILMSKEVELETSKQRIKELENKLKYTGALNLEPAPNDARQYALLKDRIKMLNESLISREKELKKKDEELAALTLVKKTLEERERYQEKEFENANMLYSNLKTQLLQATDLLTRREQEIIAKNKEILNLKSEMAILRAEYKVKEQELSDLQKRQSRTMEDLTRATQLNISLQEKMVGRFDGSTSASEDKMKADKLKKEIESLIGN